MAKKKLKITKEDVWQKVCNITHQGSSLKPWYLEVSLEYHHIGMIDFPPHDLRLYPFRDWASWPKAPPPPDHIVIICLNLWSSLWLNHRSSLNLWVSLVVKIVKRLPTVQETQVQSPGQENPLEKTMATHSSTLAWKIPWMEEPCKLQSMGLQRVWHDWATSLFFHFTLNHTVIIWFSQVPPQITLDYPTQGPQTNKDTSL